MPNSLDLRSDLAYQTSTLGKQIPLMSLNQIYGDYRD